MAASPARARVVRVLLIVGGIAAAWFAVQGGEYSSLDLLRQRQRRAELQHSIDSLTRLVDSLNAYKLKVLNDPKTQERIAREEFGMIRGKELLYRITDPDSKKP
ncbi:MAG: septum formation initiator family protein [Gemmatimonadota bacterium]